jgi:hypothetical protein
MDDIDDLTRKLGSKFSREEIEGFIDLGRKLVSKSVLTLLCRTVTEAAGGFTAVDVESDSSASSSLESRHPSEVPIEASSQHVGTSSQPANPSSQQINTPKVSTAQHETLKARQRKATQLCAAINAQMPFAGIIPATIEFTEIPDKLNLILSIVPRNYVADIQFPHERYKPDIVNQYEFIKHAAYVYWIEFSRRNPRLISKIAKFAPDVDFSELKVDPQSLTTMYFSPLSTTRLGIFGFYTDKNGKKFDLKPK